MEPPCVTSTFCSFIARLGIWFPKFFMITVLTTVSNNRDVPLFIHNCLTKNMMKCEVLLTDGLRCTHSCSSHSHHILSSHWHSVIAWGRIWVWLKGMTTPPSCALSNVHIHSSHNRPSLVTDLVLCDIPSYSRAWIFWILWWRRDVQGCHRLS